ncbi:hypothetical protein FHETE_3722 [Fusarium heterosporum]|uniref:Uncharacterized protein n=1 Tax=Fusarium heterosporum TaxID=42747 RepID=A0A8H5WWA0_FUSHE|nr:hypothetical protein FHETE_3722 [Fusarium heterosporum]
MTDTSGPSEGSVSNASEDIAKDRRCLQMRVQVEGRSTESMKDSNGNYVSFEYQRPLIEYPTMPSGDELINDPKNTKAYIEQTSPTMKKDVTILDRDENALRVFTPVFDTAPIQAKLFVGYSYSKGRLFPAKIAADAPNAGLAAKNATIGNTAFFNFDSDLTKDQAAHLIDKMSTLNSKLSRLNNDFVMAIHKALRTNVGNSDKEKSKLRNFLPRRSLPFFLECCFGKIPMAGADEDSIWREVKEILPFCKWHCNNCPRTPLKS